MYFDESYNICLKHFAKFSVFSRVNAKNHDFHGVFMVFTMEIIYLAILTIIFVISALKNVSTHSSKEIRGFTYSELYPYINI